MTAYTYDFNGTDQSPPPTPNGYPTLTATSGTWYRQSNRAYTSSSGNSNPMLTVTLGTGNIDIKSDVSYAGGDAVYFRVQDTSNWWRVISYSYTYSYNYYTTEYEYNGGYTGNDCVGPIQGQLTRWDQNFPASYQEWSSYCQEYETLTLQIIIPTGNSRQIQHTGWDTVYQSRLQKCVAGQITTIETLGWTPQTIRVRAVDQQIQVYMNNSSTPGLTYNDAQFMTANKHGIGRGYSENNGSALDNMVVDGLNSPPNAPTLNYPTGSVTINKDNVNRFTWTFSDPDFVDSQSAYDLQYRVVGAGSWTSVNGTTTNNYRDFAAGTFAASNYEWQVKTYDSQGVAGAWSTSAYFTGAAAPSGPTITAPTSGGTISVDYYDVTWSIPTQTDYQVQVIQSAVTVYDSGAVTTSTARFHTTPFPNNGVSVTIQVRIKVGGLWSSYVPVTATVSYTPPAVPSVYASWEDIFNMGFGSAIRIVATHPTPSGNQPTVINQTIQFRETDSTEVYDFVVNGHLNAHTWFEPKLGAVSYQVRVIAFGSSGVSSATEWTDIAGTSAITGFILHDPDSPFDTGVYVRQNDSGAVDTINLEAELIELQGRTSPIVEYGDGISRTLEVPLIYADNGESQDMRNLISTRKILCYRDKWGRRVFGAVLEHEESDVFWGQKTSLVITEVDY